MCSFQSNSTLLAPKITHGYRRGPITIIPTEGNRDNSLPAHWDLRLDGQADSLITVWDGLEMAELCADFLIEWSAKRHAARVAEIRA